MGNIQGQFSVGSYYNITAGAPLDVRTLVKKETDLTAEDSWNSKTHPVYKGMFVVVQETGNVYVLTDPGNVHSTNSWKKVGSDSDLVPFEKGDADNSAVLKGGDNQVISEGGVALGSNNIVGLKGWYYKAIQFNTNTNNIYLYLTQTQQVPVVVTSVKDVSNPEKTISFNLPNGTVLSIINDVKYDNQFRLVGNDISKYGRIIVTPLSGEFPFNDIKTDDDLNDNKFDSEDYSVYSIDNPLSGIADMGEFSVAIGLDNKATNNKAVAFGYNNHSYGKFSFTEGRDNKAAYCSHAEGNGTQANGLTSHSEGAGTQANGDMSHAEGKGTITTGKCSHAEGRDTQAIGANSHAEGQLTVVIGNNSHASGYKTVANNNEEATFGRFNKSNENTQFSIGIGTSDTDRKNAFEVKQNGDIYVKGVGGYDGTNPDSSDDLATVLSNRSDANGGGMTNVTYSELIELRNNSQLIAGMQYRITDYVTTTAQENTQSAGHAFDIIVVADDEKTLNEEARACLHDGDTYFANSNLAAWKVWYCLDNDQDRFVWAIKYDAIKLLYSDGMSYIYRRYKDADKDDKIAWALVESSENAAFGSVYLDKININDIVLTEQNVSSGDAIEFDGELIDIVEKIVRGKGVIYRMVDEWGNDCPYDFKNIQFKRNLNFDDGNAEFSEDGEETWVYTFAGQSYHVNNDEWSDMLDGSLESPFGHMSDEGTSTFHDNIIKPYIMVYNGNDVYTECGIRYLNDNVLLGYWEEIGSANEEDAPYYFAYCCYDNSFGNNCHNNSFGNDCYYNSFGNGCNSNSFGNYCCSNSFGNNCHNNSFGNNCSSNSFGSDCYGNSLYEVHNTTILSGVGKKKDIDQSYVMVATNSQGEVKVFNIADLVE